MPSASWNLETWDEDYDWSQAGEEWSVPWGGSEAQWHGSLLPRIHRFLPASRVVEIAPGYGRWTRFLIPACSSFVGIDLSPNCVEVCKQRFKSAPHAQFTANDGVSLDAVKDGSADFVFSFDSLVHAEIEVLEAYIPQIIRKLAPGGAAFIHHSNLAEGKILEGAHSHSRADSVSAPRVADIINRAGGRVLVQERISWMDAGLIDCISLFARAEDFTDAAPQNLHNFEFMREAGLIRKYVSAYTGSPHA